MSDNRNLAKIRLFILTAALAAGVGTASGTAFADNDAVSERDMLLQAVALYEKLNGTEIEVPQSIADACGGSELGKAVVLGFTNIEDIDSLSEAVSLRKQDALTVLYKTIIDFDDSFALSGDEVDEIMSRCYDNALVDEENRVGFAFMLKHGIMESGMNTEPNKEINWDGCRILIDRIYDMFVQNVTFDIGGIEVKMGANIDTVTSLLGEPQRIDRGDYGYDWYVYNSDYNYFMMIGVENGRICGFFSNSGLLSFNDLKVGGGYGGTYKYSEKDGYRFYADEDGHLDAVLFNTRAKSDVISEVAPEVSAFELADMINAYRVKNNMHPLSVSRSMSENAMDMAAQPKYLRLARDMRYEHTMNGARHETGYDTFTVYSVLANNGGECFAPAVRSVGIGTHVTDDYYVIASVITDKSKNASDTVNADAAGIAAMAQATEEPKSDAELVTIAEINSIAEQSEENAKAEIEDAYSPAGETEYAEDTDTAVLPINERYKPAAYDGIAVEEGKDFVIALSDAYPDKYYVRIYSFEDDAYIANSCMNVTDKKLVLDSDMFEAGKDYAILIRPYDSSDSEEFVISYGTIPDDAVVITPPGENGVIDDDTIKLSWSSEIYSDFLIDIYDEEGNLQLTQAVSDTMSASISNVKPGIYDIRINAIRRGSEDFVKATAETQIEVKLPEPVICEYILEEGERFYPVYADEDMGLVYFYDEDIIEVTNSVNGSTVKRKKITEKQVKATGYYKKLADRQPKVDYFTGSETRDIEVNEEDLSFIAYDGMSVSDNTAGAAIVAEAKKYLGIPYLWGGTTPNGFDCSGLCQYVYKNVGINISRVSQTQYLEGVHISREYLQPGDLVFFNKNGDVHHVGIYVGNGNMIHAPYTGAYVRYQSIDSGHYKDQFCGGRRIFADGTEQSED